MKKTAIALILLNIFSICSASYVGRGANIIYKNSSQNAAQNLKNAHKLKNSQNNKVTMPPTATNNMNMPPAPTNNMTPAAAPQQATQIVKTIPTTPPATYKTRAEAAEAAQATQATQARSIARQDVAHTLRTNQASAAREGAQKGHDMNIINQTPSGLSTFDKAYLGGSFASVAAIFGYDALKNEEKNLTEPAAQVAEKVVLPVTLSTEDQQLFNQILGTINEKPTKEISINDASSDMPIDANIDNSSSQTTTFTDFAKKHAYENPTNALTDLYKNPSGANALNALQDPMIAGVLATAAIGGIGAYGYYQYLQYLERIAKEKDAQAPSENNENDDESSMSDQPAA